MTIDLFAETVAINKKRKERINLTQIKEILKITNKLTRGSLYKIISLMGE